MASTHWWLEREQRLDPSIQVFNTVQSLTRQRRWRSILKILDFLSKDAEAELVGKVIYAGLPTMTTLLSSCAVSSQWRRALFLTKQFLRHRTQDLGDLSDLRMETIQILTDFGLVKAAWSFLSLEVFQDDAIERCRSSCSAVSGNLLRRALKLSEWAIAVQLLKCFQDLHVKPSAKLHTDALLGIALRHLSWQAAMQLAASGLQLGAFSYTSLVRLSPGWLMGFALVQRARARAELSALSRQSSLVDELLSARQGQDWKAVMAFAHSMGRSSLKDGALALSHRAMEVLLHSAAGDGLRKGSWSEALVAYERLKFCYGNLPNDDAFSLIDMMRAFVPGSQWRVSIQILGHLRSSTREPATRALSYILALRAFSRTRTWHPVVALLDEVNHQGVQWHIGMYDAALESCKGTWAYPWSQWTRSMGLLQLTQGHLLRCNPFMLQATLRACQSNYEWRPSIALLRCLLGNALEAHSEQYSAALAVCAKAMQWTWGLHFLRGTMP
ncbi:unnamed protein product [Durusdinium trenchii]|uniref:Uncharacterized protein n=1 Tax=Durusdinium trenchii TaxID=1381693 RepID=A0ABP0PYV3_9DINO